MKKVIFWRFDDLCFDKNNDYYISLSKIKKIADIFYQNRQQANFALIIDNSIFSKEGRECINYLIKQGHSILAHGAPHSNWQKLNEVEIKKAVINMRKNFDKFGIKTNVFVFPGLKANYLSYRWLKKYGFDIIIKGDRLKGLSRFIDWFYSKVYCIKFIYQDSCTNDKDWNLKPIRDFYKIVSDDKRRIHVMDHLWIYRKNSLKEFEKFIKTTAKYVSYQIIK